MPVRVLALAVTGALALGWVASWWPSRAIRRGRPAEVLPSHEQIRDARQRNHPWPPARTPLICSSRQERQTPLSLAFANTVVAPLSSPGAFGIVDFMEPKNLGSDPKKLLMILIGVAAIAIAIWSVIENINGKSNAVMPGILLVLMVVLRLLRPPKKSGVPKE